MSRKRDYSSVWFKIGVLGCKNLTITVKEWKSEFYLWTQKLTRRNVMSNIDKNRPFNKSLLKNDRVTGIGTVLAV